MENMDKVIEFAPIIVVILMFVWQNNVFVRPEQLEKKHREIMDDMKKNFVEINAYKEFQNHIYSELEKVNGKMDELNDSINDIKGVLMSRRKDDI